MTTRTFTYDTITDVYREDGGSALMVVLHDAKTVAHPNGTYLVWHGWQDPPFTEPPHREMREALGIEQWDPAESGMKRPDDKDVRLPPRRVRVTLEISDE